MNATQVLSRKNARRGWARLLSGLAAATCLTMGMAGCGEEDPVEGITGDNNIEGIGPSPMTVANLEDFMERVEGPADAIAIGCRDDKDELKYKGENQVDTSTCLMPNTAKPATFYICRFEVTQGLWKEVMGDVGNSVASKWWYKGDNLPVTNVNRYDIADFFTALNGNGQYTYRLPVEAEWEYAAKGGENSSNKKYSGSDAAGDVAWYGGNNGPHPVGKKRANEAGLYDMSGNVWETVGIGTSTRRAERGGSWYGEEKYCSVTYRNYLGAAYSAPEYSLDDLGFRIARNKLDSE